MKEPSPAAAMLLPPALLSDRGPARNRTSDRHGWRKCRKCRSIFRPCAQTCGLSPAIASGARLALRHKSEQRTANSEQRTANSEQRTANSEEQQPRSVSQASSGSRIYPEFQGRNPGASLEPSRWCGKFASSRSLPDRCAAWRICIRAMQPSSRELDVCKRAMEARDAAELLVPLADKTVALRSRTATA